MSVIAFDDMRIYSFRVWNDVNTSPLIFFNNSYTCRFPPRLFHQLAEMFNNSQSEYLICYHGPKLMIDRYEFNIELLVQTPTSMHGSAEGHQGYIYRRTTKANKRNSCITSQFDIPCDPLFAKAWDVCREGLDAVSKHTADEVEKHMGSKSKRVTRSASKRLSTEEKKEE